LKNFSPRGAGGPRQLVHKSSGRVRHGTRYTTEIEMLRNEDEPAAAALVQALQVECISCPEHARDCHFGKRSRDVAVMGISLDCEVAQRTSDSAAPMNLLASLIVAHGGVSTSTARAGYIVTRRGGHLGMSRYFVRDFAFVKPTEKGVAGGEDASTARGRQTPDTFCT